MTNSTKQLGVAMITGATSGIGWATALRLARAGYELVLLGRRQDRLQELDKIIQREAPTKTSLLQIDVRERSQLEALAKVRSSEFWNLRVIINNAGLALGGTSGFQESSIDDMDQMIDTNIKGLIYVTRLFIPFMVQRGFGDVINIGSVAGRWVYPGGHVYCATKFSVRALSEGLRMDLKGKGIRVTNIEPGMVETEFSQVRFQDEQRAKAVYEGMSPLVAEDIAESILWCLERPRHVNVQELVLFPTDQAAVGMVHRRD